MNRVFRVACVAAIVIAGASSAPAQYGNWRMGMGMPSAGEAAIAGVGTVTVERSPSSLRMHLELTVKGTTLEDALAKLKERRESAAAALEKMGADKDSIKLSAPGLAGGQSSQRRQMEMMVRQRMAARGKKLPKGLKPTAVQTVSALLTADWPLTGKTPEEWLLASVAIQEKVKAADLAGVKESEQEVSEEEEEMAEQMAEMSNMSGEEEIPPGTPHFVYLARITAEDREKAMAEAFEKAKAQAADVAKAAGVPLGPLVGLSGTGGGAASYNDGMNSYSYRQSNMLQRLIMQQQEEGDELKRDLAIASSLTTLKFHFQVSATFALGNAEKR